MCTKSDNPNANSILKADKPDANPKSLMDFAGSLDTDEADEMLRAINDKNSKDIDL